ncbi:transcription factor VOZ1-like isoform X2 [Phoenix dactylifera]|uniref:Transcription factor VOZ1-like isoform X2 n=1 Tax=Phoenix dactylifera TaxID=42345 RepID=A0A8B7BSG6_PHODC|nr:transcription factor VOZ1-like isoform X2 [Phoenix dactylifera]
MRKGSKSGACRSAAHGLLKERAKNRVDDLQGMLSDLQAARKESRAADAALLEEQVHQMLREWKAELDEASPASSLLGHSDASSDLSSYIRRMLQLNEEEDDATSRLAELPPAANPKLEPLPVLRSDLGGGAPAFLDELPEHGCLGAEQYKSSLSTGVQQAALNYLEGNTNSDYQQFSLHQELHHNVFIGFDDSRKNGGAVVPLISEFIPAICPPPSAFLMPKCALWDCPRPARGSEWYQDYCSSFHATLALHEGPPGMTPVLRPGGIDLKDGPLFAALTAKTQGKNVGIPECEGAATAKSPWNAPELFDLLVLNGESLREWLFFDKPRRAFESGNRKQRSLPDYNGRGWHESRKQVMKEFGGLKRSYYMDPQPLNHYEWHLYEYEINYCDSCALYRLEFKLVDPNKSAKGKVMTDSLVDLQQQMGRLNAENPLDNKQYIKGRVKVKQKDADENACLASNMVNQREHSQKLYSTLDQKAPIDENLCYGPSMPYAYSVDNLKNYYGT